MTSRPSGPEAGPTPPPTWLPLGLMSVIRRRWWLVAGAVAVALGLAFVYHRTTPPVYEATAQLLVVKKLPDAVTGVDTRALSVEDYVATHQTLLHSPLLVGQAIRKHNLAALASFAGEKDVTETILQGLTVLRNKAPGGNTDNVLNLFYYGPNARDCPVVLDALIDSFKDHLDETYRTIAGESLRLIAQARSELHEELLEKEAAYRRFRKETPLVLLKGKDEATLRQDQLSAIDAKRSTLRIRRAELRGQLAVLEAALREGGKHDALVAMVMGWTAQADVARGMVQTTVPDRLLPLLAEEQKLLETRGEKHPEVIALRQRIEATRRLLAAPSAPWRPGAGKPPTDGDGADPVEAYRSYCRQELRHLEIADQFLSELYQKEHDRARALAASELEDEGYRVALERQQRLYDSVIKQLQQVDLVKNLGGYEAQVIGPPGAGKKIRPNALILLPGAVFLGLLGGFGLAFVAEVRDRRLHSAAEIRTLLGLPVLAHVPRFSGCEGRQPLSGADRSCATELAGGRSVPPSAHRLVLRSGGRRLPFHSGDQSERRRREYDAGGQPGGVDGPVRPAHPPRRWQPAPAAPARIVPASRRAGLDVRPRRHGLRRGGDSGHPGRGLIGAPGWSGYVVSGRPAHDAGFPEAVGRPGGAVRLRDCRCPGPAHPDGGRRHCGVRGRRSAERARGQEQPAHGAAGGCRAA